MRAQLLAGEGAAPVPQQVVQQVELRATQAHGVGAVAQVAAGQVQLKSRPEADAGPAKPLPGNAAQQPLPHQ